MTGRRLLVVAGALCGAAGVALAAMAAHLGGANLDTAALLLLVHAPLFVALGLAGSGWALLTGGWVVLAGLWLFSCDLMLRHYAGARLFPMAAPTGGVLMIAGWLVVAAGGLLRKMEEQR